MVLICDETVCEHFNLLNNCAKCGDTTMYFNIDKTLNIDAEIEKACKYRVSHLWDEDGNCTQDRLGIERWFNVKSAIEYLLKEQNAVSVLTVCGLTVARGKSKA